MRSSATVRAATVPAPRRAPGKHLRLATGLTCAAALVAGVASSPDAQARSAPRRMTTSATQPVSFTAAAEAAEGVINPSAAIDTAGWTAGSNAGPITIARDLVTDGPTGVTTAIGLQRAGGTGTWAMALTPLRTPTTFFTVGQTYRMQAWVRDRSASGKSIGILIANNHYSNRPTEVTAYGSFTDTAWHLLTKTFVATSVGYADTQFYVALPSSGALSWQVSAASVQEVVVPQPASVTGTPASQVLSFGGAAGTGPNTSQWSIETGGSGWGNGQLETYTTRPSNVSVDGKGNLLLTVRRETYTGTDGYTRNYTSGRVTSKGKVNVAPGSYVEAPITAPVGNAVWPAFWTVGSNVGTVGWPASGELDVLEVSGSKPTIAHSALHMSSLTNASQDMLYGWGEAGGSVDLGESLDARPHTYGVYFDADTVRYYIDRKLTRVIWATDAAATGRAWPFGKPQYMIMNVAVDGRGDPSTTTFPRTMTIGSVSIWNGGVPF